MNLLLLALAGMLVLLTVAWLKPDWFRKLRETTLAQAWIFLVGFFYEVYNWMVADPSWQAIIPIQYVPYIMMGMGLIGIVLRNINTSPGDKEDGVL